MGTAVKHPVPARVKPSLVIFNIWALWHSALSVRVPGCQKLQMMAEPGLAQDALQLYLYGNSGHQVVKYVRHCCGVQSVCCSYVNTASCVGRRWWYIHPQSLRHETAVRDVLFITWSSRCLRPVSRNASAWQRHSKLPGLQWLGQHEDLWYR